jgi:hypothetical protein
MKLNKLEQVEMSKSDFRTRTFRVLFCGGPKVVHLVRKSKWGGVKTYGALVEIPFHLYGRFGLKAIRRTQPPDATAR